MCWQEKEKGKKGGKKEESETKDEKPAEIIAEPSAVETDTKLEGRSRKYRT